MSKWKKVDDRNHCENCPYYHYDDKGQKHCYADTNDFCLEVSYQLEEDKDEYEN